MKRRKNNRVSEKIILVCLAVLLICSGCSLQENTTTLNASFNSHWKFQARFLDVGQGDGIILKSENAIIVIDGGEALSSGAVIQSLQNDGIQTVDCYVATHPHSDHIGAAKSIFNTFAIKEVIMTSFSAINMPTTKTYENFMLAVDEEDCRVNFVTAGESYTYGDITLNVLAPFEECDDYNNMSVVLHVKYGSVELLLMGDAGKSIEKKILAQYPNIDADVIKIGHHGSSSATSVEFLSSVDPEIAVISCGKNNQYNHPHSETITLLREYGLQLFRTDDNGDITVNSDGRKIVVTKEY